MNRPPVNILDRPLGTRGSRSTADTTVSLSSFAYLYSELVQYHQNRVDSISELERRLESSGYGVGLKVLELLAFRSREYKREIRIMNVLQFISTHVWKSLYGKAADSLERSIDHADEYMIVDYEPITSTFVSVPSDFGQLSVDAYMSGIISGVLHGAGFMARVTAHSVKLEDGETNPNHPTSSSSSGMSSSSTSSGAAVQHHSTMNYSSSSGGVVPGTTGITSSSSGNPHPLSTVPSRREKAVFLVKFSPEVLERDAIMDR